MKTRKPLLPVLMMSVLLTTMLSHAGAQTLSLDTVLKNCEKKTLVYGRDEKGGIVKVGDALDDYCRGILEGMFAVLAHARTVCAKDKNPSPEFLLSTVLTYRAETKSQDRDAADVIEAAFKRAFSCPK